MLKKVATILNSKQSLIDNWYQHKLSQGKNCIYSSVDLRYMGSKLVPVDTNLFPAGFNNLNDLEIEKAASLIKAALPKDITKILLLGEDHTRNPYYFDNLKTIENILRQAGYICQIATLSASEVIQYNGMLLSDIVINPIIKKQDLLQTSSGFCPALILLNNDLMTGMPDILNDISQPIIPHPLNGWFNRRKSHHFTIYNCLMQELEELFGIPSFALTAEFSNCSNIDFQSKQGLEELAESVDDLLQIIKAKYKAYNINEEPYVVIKSDYGTYGMGIMMVKSADEIVNLNKKLRKQMHMTKNNIINNQVLLQEGIKSIDQVEGAIAEPMLYMINHQLVSFLYRHHDQKNEYDNLNSVGMKFSSSKLEQNEYYQCCEFVAKMATLAAALELY